MLRTCKNWCFGCVVGQYFSRDRGPLSADIIVDLAVKFAKENPTWGFDWIQSELSKVGYQISDSTVSNILKAHGIEPAPNRQRTGSWATFLKSHWDVMAAIDFTSVEVWTKSGLVTFYLLYVTELKTRRVHFARIHDKSPRNLGEADGSRVDQP